MGAFCPACGEQVETDWRFCYACGAEQPVVTRSDQAESSPTVDPGHAIEAQLRAEAEEAERIASEQRAEAERAAAQRLADAERAAAIERAEAAERAAEEERRAELERRAAAEREAADAAERAAQARAEAEAAAEAARRTAEQEAAAAIRAEQARAHAEAAAEAELKAAAAAKTVADARAEAQAKADEISLAASKARSEAEAAAQLEAEAAARAREVSETASSAAPRGFGSPISEIDPDAEAEVTALLAAAEPVSESSIWPTEAGVLTGDDTADVGEVDVDVAAVPDPDTAPTNDDAEAANLEPAEASSATRRLTAASPLATRARRASRRSSTTGDGYQFPEAPEPLDDELIPSTNQTAAHTGPEQTAVAPMGTYQPPGPTGRLAQKGLLLAALLCIVTVGSLLRLNSMLDGVLAGDTNRLSDATDAQSMINNILLPLMALTAIGSYFLVGSWALTMHRNLDLVRSPSGSARTVRWGLALPVLNLVYGKGILADLSPPLADQTRRRTNPWILIWWVLSLAGLAIATVSLLNSAATVDQASGANTWSAIGYGLLALSLLSCVVVVATLTYEHERWAVDEFGLPRSLRPRYGVLQRLGFASPADPDSAHVE